MASDTDPSETLVVSISRMQAPLPGALPLPCRLIIQSAELGKAMLFYSYFSSPPQNYWIVLFLGTCKALISLLSYLKEKFDSPQLGKSSPSLFHFSPQPKLGRTFIKYRSHFLRWK